VVTYEMVYPPTNGHRSIHVLTRQCAAWSRTHDLLIVVTFMTAPMTGLSRLVQRREILSGWNRFLLCLYEMSQTHAAMTNWPVATQYPIRSHTQPRREIWGLKLILCV